MVAPVKKRERRFSPGREAFRRFRRHRLAAASVVVLLLLALAILIGPALWPVPINDIDFTARLAPRYCNLRKATIYAGSNEIQRNIIAKATLGL